MHVVDGSTLLSCKTTIPGLGVILILIKAIAVMAALWSGGWEHSRPTEICCPLPLRKHWTSMVSILLPLLKLLVSAPMPEENEFNEPGVSACLPLTPPLSLGT